MSVSARTVRCVTRLAGSATVRQAGGGSSATPPVRWGGTGGSARRSAPAATAAPATMSQVGIVSSEPMPSHFSVGSGHRRMIKTEEKAKVVAAAWGK